MSAANPCRPQPCPPGSVNSCLTKQTHFPREILSWQRQHPLPREFLPVTSSDLTSLLDCSQTGGTGIPLGQKARNLSRIPWGLARMDGRRSEPTTDPKPGRNSWCEFTCQAGKVTRMGLGAAGGDHPQFGREHSKGKKPFGMRTAEPALWSLVRGGECLSGAVSLAPTPSLFLWFAPQKRMT